VKRYRLTIDRNMDGELKLRTYVSDQGEWVKHEDVEVELSELSRITEIYERRIRELKECIGRAFDNGVKAGRHWGIENDPKTHLQPGIKTPECNCKEMTKHKPASLSRGNLFGDSLLPQSPDYWICPAHGYKKR